MIVVGLTGGIGSGKSTVSARLAARGAVIVDADLVTRQLQEPGHPVLGRLVERYGADIIDEHGALIRQRLADIVFADPAALADLNGIMHPAVREEMGRQVNEQRDTDKVVVLDAALLVETSNHRPQGVIVVDAPVDVAVERLVTFRGLAEADARARIARQATREERLAKADFVVDNAGPPEALDEQLDRLWDWIQTIEQVHGYQLPDG